ncbi:MAG TPA: Gfo/Idh/MocA family oxidoreductase [Candidatus Brocadiia bacterium]|nr:Gfo/Idh/MocA family oxidoreductase [Candidatus Brocadiia bacterium]
MSDAKLKIGLVGLGTFVEIAHIPCYFHSRYREFIELAAICDLSRERLERIGSECPGAARYTDHRQMFDEAGLDAAVVVTPDHAHTAIVLDALDRGLDVLVEKPMTMKISEAAQIIARARQRRRRVVTDFHKREDPAHQEARTRITSGRYGELQFGWVWMQDAICVPAGGFFKSNLAARSSPVWFLGVHFFDLIRFVTGKLPVEVRASSYRDAVKARGVDTPDAVKADFIFDNGAAISFYLGWNLPDSVPSLTTQGFYLQFSGGDVLVDSSNRGFYESTPEKYSRVNPMFLRDTPKGKAGYGVESIGEALAGFHEMKTGDRDAVYAILEREEPSGVGGFYATLMGQAIDLSLSLGRAMRDGHVTVGSIVDLNEIMKTELGDAAEEFLVRAR